MKIRRVLMEQAPYSEVQCDYCGYPMDLDEDIPHYYEVENHEHLSFCTRTCAKAAMSSPKTITNTPARGRLPLRRIFER